MHQIVDICADGGGKQVQEFACLLFEDVLLGVYYDLQLGCHKELVHVLMQCALR